MINFTVRVAVLLFMFATTIIKVNAQLLNNTRWKSYDEQNTFDLFWNFNNDTVAFSTNNANWTYVSVYIENGNVVSFRDIHTNQCDSTDVGIYHFNIIQDTLWMTAFNEPCASRADYFNTHYFVDFPIGINEIEYFKNLKIYPLPFDQELNIKTDGGLFDFLLLDITGRKVIAKSIHDQLKVDTEKLEPGVYIYQIRGKDGMVKSGNIVK